MQAAIDGIRMSYEIAASDKPAAAEAVHEQIAGSDLIVMSGVSHKLCAEGPPAFHGHVLAFPDKVATK